MVAGKDRRLGRDLTVQSFAKTPLALIYFLLIAVSLGENVQLDKLIEKIYDNYNQQRQHIKSFICEGSTVYQEYLGNGDLKKNILLTRLLYTKGEDKNHDEYLQMILNNQVLDKAEMDKQVDEWNRRGKKRGATNMPFRPSTDSLYEYVLLTDTVWGKTSVYRLGFEARPGIDNVINGIAYVNQNDHNIVRIEAIPAKLPGVIDMMKMVYHYKPVNSFMLPESFNFEMKIKIKFLINFFDRYIKLYDFYTNYRLNVDIPDTLFNGGNQ